MGFYGSTVGLGPGQGTPGGELDQCRRGRHEVLSSRVQGSPAAQPALWRSFVSANPVIGTYECSQFRTESAADSPLEGAGLELSLEIRPQKNCGFRDLAISTIVP
jgi:hypothetical protein